MPKGFGEIPPLGVKGTIGVNFSNASKPVTGLRVSDIAGAPGTAQTNWNNADLRNRKFDGLYDSEGKGTPVRISVEESAKFEACESWGFSGGDERLHRGGVAEGRIMVRDVPFRKWDLIVHLGAGVNGWSGDVTVLKPYVGEVASRAVNFGWIGGGKYVEAVWQKGADSGAADCMVVFRGLDSPSYIVSVAKGGGKGTAAIAGLQIVPAQ